jgi:hypothetical protein
MTIVNMTIVNIVLVSVIAFIVGYFIGLIDGVNERVGLRKACRNSTDKEPDDSVDVKQFKSLLYETGYCYEVMGELVELIDHCWIHAGYKDCGSRKMGTFQRDLYCLITAQDAEERIDNRLLVIIEFVREQKARQLHGRERVD